MSRKITTNRKILDAVHETAQDLYDAGFIDQRRMRQYGTELGIRKLRNRNKLSQTVFAVVLKGSKFKGNDKQHE